MEPFLILIFLSLVGGFVLLAFLLRRQSGARHDQQALILLQNQINELNRTLDSRLGESTQAIQQQFGESHKVIFGVSTQLANVAEHLTRLGETNKQVVEFADQLQALQDILKNPKQRGVLGEYYLEHLLKNVMPPGSYQMQYPFADGTIVDAVVFVKDKIIPIDSKFSLENYNRLSTERDPAERERLEKLFKADLKERIDETAKYVKPSEGTTEFVFMFIPHEAIYYDLLVAQVGSIKVNTRDLIEYAFKEKHVVIVSPTSFLAYLQTVLQGLKALQIEESAKEIRKNVEMLVRHLASYEEYLKKLGTHLGTSVNMYNNASREFKKIDKDVLKITGQAMDIEPTLLEGPLAPED